MSFALIVFLGIGSPRADRSGSHNITKDFQTRIRIPQDRLETEEGSKNQSRGAAVFERHPHLNTATPYSTLENKNQIEHSTVAFAQRAMIISK
jgi:hypothetical protein